MSGTERIWFWTKIAIAVLILLVIFQIFRVNEEPKKADTPVVRYTQGTVVEGVVKVPPGEFLSYHINLNRSTTLEGSFDTLSENIRIACLVLDEENFAKWEKQEEYVALVETGHLPTAEMNPRIGPGRYRLVFSGRDNFEKNVNAEVLFAVK